MTDRNEPLKDLSAIHGVVMQAWACALGEAPVTYLSGPITTGLRHILRIRAGQTDTASKDAVIEQNCSALREAAAKLRQIRPEIVLEPGSLNVVGWSQDDYNSLWANLIERHVKMVVFMPKWEYSLGCALEFERATIKGIRTESVSSAPISLEQGIDLLKSASADLAKEGSDGSLSQLGSNLEDIAQKLIGLQRTCLVSSGGLRKDASLDHLAGQGFNVAQFVSFSPQHGKPHQEFSRIAGREENATFPDLRVAIETLLQTSPENQINVRSFEPFNPQSREFIYGLKSVDETVAAVQRLTADGLHTIVNETVDINDGGVSGVLMGDIIEFAPDDTPRCVEKPGTASLPRGLGLAVLETVYRLPLRLNVPLASRIEFSVHSRPRGYLQTNVLAWEYAEQAAVGAKAITDWPNSFSRMIGDKTFGLLVAHHLGLPVPFTIAMSRRVSPFAFGKATGWGETWVRTAPSEPVPGKFPTQRGWSDPYTLLQWHDAGASEVAAVLSQEGVRPEYSGALIVGSSGQLVIEGKRGEGESLMLGKIAPEHLPSEIVDEVSDLYKLAEAALGPVRMEWVHDGERAWIVQLHRGATESDRSWITQAEADRWIAFDVSQGLEALREKIASAPNGTGIALKGRVGMTSHFADVLRKAGIPARMEG